MHRLRIRVELQRRDAGVPLAKLVSVVQETQKFLKLLAQDVQIDAGPGDWVAADFDNESLNFTAEYTRPVPTERVQAFCAAFSGSTSLRKATIAQFTQIADVIGEDELIGFGLYQSDQEKEPSEWRCLSRRDAVRIASDIRMLAMAASEQDSESRLPAVQDGSVGGRRLFRDRREGKPPVVDPSKSLRELETGLLQRIALLERQVELCNRKVDAMGNSSSAANERFQQMLVAMETFWGRAPAAYRQLPEPPQNSTPGRIDRRPRWISATIILLLCVSIAILALVLNPELILSDSILAR